MTAPTLPRSALPREVFVYAWTYMNTAGITADTSARSLHEERCHSEYGGSITSETGRYVLADDAQLICPVCLAAHEPVTVCHECVRLKAKREAEEEIAAWLRSRNNDKQAMAIWAECADAIERGEHRKAER